MVGSVLEFHANVTLVVVARAGNCIKTKAGRIRLNTLSLILNQDRSENTSCELLRISLLKSNNPPP
jgi:hypothetical protein